jgi:hypothetical protein
MFSQRDWIDAIGADSTLETKVSINRCLTSGVCSAILFFDALGFDTAPARSQFSAQ